jgi:hypothetical protein
MLANTKLMTVRLLVVLFVACGFAIEQSTTVQSALGQTAPAPKPDPEAKIGAGGQLIIGGFDPSSRADAEKSAKGFEAAIGSMKSIGVTSHEVYVRWNLCEVEPGKWDWSVYDPYVKIYKEHGMKWVPFLICGSPYSLPDWYYKKPGSQGYVCLEHGEASDVQSLWNPAMREHVAAFIKAFCEHYKDSGTIESILLGVTGNYGEAIYPVTGNDWTADVHGKYHTHPGFWAGDPFAVKSFRAWVKAKYQTDEKLKAAWGENAPPIDQVTPVLKKNLKTNERSWIDFLDWYSGSMTDYARFWLAETRKNFPTGDIYLCTGGHAPPPHGSDFAEQCKAAAQVHGGVRITNEASEYPLNFSLTRWVASAGEQYGAYYSFEPAGPVDPAGVVARVYNAAASGARGLHYYYPNLFDKPESKANFIRTESEFRQRKPIVEIAMYYPSASIKLLGQDFLGHVRDLRDRFDFNYLSDGQIRDGGLAKVKALIIVGAKVFDEPVLQAIEQWVAKGGLVLIDDFPDGIRLVDGPAQHLNSTGAGRVLRPRQGSSESAAWQNFVTATLADAPELSPATRAMIKADGQDDGLFVTVLEGGDLLWFNSKPEPQKPHGAEQISVPAHSILLQPRLD